MVVIYALFPSPIKGINEHSPYTRIMQSVINRYNTGKRGRNEDVGYLTVAR